MRYTAFLSLLCLPLVCADPSQLTLFHRVYHPISRHVPFSKRGTLIFSDSTGSHVTFQPSQTLSRDLGQFSEALLTTEGGAEDALYQVALERDGDLVEGHWDISSVKVCHLHQITSDYIILHTTDQHNVRPYALDYFVSPTPHDGSCPQSNPTKSTSNAPNLDQKTHSLANSFDGLNTTLFIRASRFPPLPELRIPPPLSPEGEPIQPIPEKTFLQKYWMYLAALSVALLLSGGGEEEQPRQ